MKKKLLIIFVTLLVFILGSVLIIKQSNKDEKLRRQYAKFLKASSYQKTLKMSEEQRLAKGIPPNKYNEQEYLLEMNPALGRPTPEKLFKLQEQLNNRVKTSRAPGDASDNKWVERGPNNIGGRTRVLVYDPNDTTHKRVFAGGISGGLWVNDNITDSNSSWTRVGIPENLSVSCMTVDPMNSQIMYIGTGESYTNAAVTGNGIWKSTNGGNSWSKIYNAVETLNTPAANKLFFVNDIIAWKNNGNTVLFAGVGSAYYPYGQGSSDSNSFPGSNTTGLYTSIDNGSTWTKITLNIPSTSHPYEPNDLDIAADNTIWMATKNNVYGDGGGAILSSSDGITFSLKHTIQNGKRTQIAVSGINAGTIFALAEMSTSNAPIKLIETTDSFSTTTTLNLPKDSDTDISDNDFTRGQAFYDLTLEVDPSKDSILYAGGIDFFRSIDGGVTWPQITKWSNNNDLKDLHVSTVHSDHHAITFNPSNLNEAVIGCDGGVYYASDLVNASSGKTISQRNKNYNVTQFYKGAIGQSTTNELFLAGAQDNGSQFIKGLTSGVNSGQDIYGGDGAYEFIDKDGKYMIVSYVYNTYTRIDLPYTGSSDGYATIVDDQNSGQFINPADLDDNLDILYTDGSTDDNYKISIYSKLMTSSPVRSNFTNPSLTAKPTAFKVSPYTTTSTTLFVGTMNGLLLKINKADSKFFKTWTDISPTTSPEFVGSISSINFGANENEIMVTFHNYGVNNIWYTVNGGTTWAVKDGDFPDIPVKAIMMNPLNNNEVIIGTDLGVWKTQNFGDTTPSWKQSQNGMSNVKVTSFDYRTADNTVLASTYGRGLFTGKFLGGFLAVHKEKFSKSKILVRSVNSDGSILIFPQVDNGKTLIKIYDTTGKQVFSKVVNLSKGDQKQVFVNLKMGLYFLNFTSKKLNFYKKIIIK